MTSAFQSQPSKSHTFLQPYDILDLRNVGINTKFEFVSYLQPEISMIMQKGVDLNFQDHAVEIKKTL